MINNLINSQKKVALGLLTTVGLMVGVAPAEAGILTFKLEDATFADVEVDGVMRDGGTLNGTFQYDTEDNMFLDTYNIVTDSKLINGNKFTWRNANSDITDPGNSQMFQLEDTLDDNTDRNLRLEFNTDLSTLFLNQESELLTTESFNLLDILQVSYESLSQGGGSEIAAISGGVVKVIRHDSVSTPEPTSVVSFLLVGALGASSVANRRAKQKQEKITL